MPPTLQDRAKDAANIWQTEITNMRTTPKASHIGASEALALKGVAEAIRIWRRTKLAARQTRAFSERAE